MSDSWQEPLLLIHQFREFGVGDRINVDGRPALIRHIRMNTGTVLRAEIEVFETEHDRETAELREMWTACAQSGAKREQAS